MGVILIRNLIEGACDKAWNVGKCLFAIGVVKSMQHAVVGVHKYHGSARFVGVEKSVVRGAGDGRGRLAHVHQSAVDDVTQEGVPWPKKGVWRARLDLVGSVAP